MILHGLMTMFIVCVYNYNTLKEPVGLIISTEYNIHVHLYVIESESSSRLSSNGSDNENGMKCRQTEANFIPNCIQCQKG